MTFICAICGVDFDIEAGRCPKCGCERKLVTVREELKVKDWMEWIERVEGDPEYRDRHSLIFEKMAESRNEEGVTTRERRIIDTVHGIMMRVEEIRDSSGEFTVIRIREERLGQK